MRLHWFTFLALLLLLAACQPATEAPAATSTALPETPTPTESPTRTPRPTLTASPTVSADILQYRCLEILDEPPEDAQPSGRLILEGMQTYSYDFSEDTLETLPENGYMFSVSPNRSWLAYEEIAADSPTGLWLTVENTQGQRTRIPQHEKWTFPMWISDHQMQLTIVDTLSSIHPAALVDPFSGVVRVIPSEYPGLGLTYMGPSGTSMHFDISTVVYSPSANLVTYGATDGGVRIVLWDRNRNAEIASIPDGTSVHQYPAWQPDESRFYIAITGETGSNELFSVSRDGEVDQLTRFSDLFDADIYMNIWTDALSPDGQQLAFWLRTAPNLSGDPSLTSKLTLTILDLDDRRVTNYCLPGDAVAWSPDGRYLVLSQEHPVNFSHFILVDPVLGWATEIDQIPEGLHRISGWMLAP